MVRFGYNRGAQLLRQLREGQGLSQRALSAELGLSQGAVCHLEGGRHGPLLVLAVTIERWAADRGVDLPPRAWCEPAIAETERAA